MADNTTFEKYQESGHSQASGVSDLQQQVSKIPVSDDALRKQAEAQYADTLKTLDDSYSKQISALITSQANDEKLLNEQYNNSISSMMAQLKKRGLDVTEALPQAQTAAINRHRNDTMTVRRSLYSAQRSLPEQQKQLLSTDYEKAIAQRVSANRATNIPVRSATMRWMTKPVPALTAYTISKSAASQAIARFCWASLRMRQETGTQRATAAEKARQSTAPANASCPAMTSFPGLVL